MASDAHSGYSFSQQTPSMQSVYALDASVTKTMNAIPEPRIPLISVKLKCIEILFLKNCVSNKEIYFSIEIKSVDGYFAENKLIYSIEKSPILITIEKEKENDCKIMLQNILVCADSLHSALNFLKILK